MNLECEVIARMLETARQRFLEKNGNYYAHLEKTGQHVSKEEWLKSSGDGPIIEAVTYAASVNDVQSSDMMEKVHAGLKWRVLAGTLTTPLYYDDPEDHPGVCGRIKADEGHWDCKLPDSSKQSKADTFHKLYGYGPHCPLWENPSSENIADVDDETELEKAMHEGLDVREQEKLLRNYHKRGV